VIDTYSSLARDTVPYQVHPYTTVALLLNILSSLLAQEKL
jgi:hypothetical protein